MIEAIRGYGLDSWFVIQSFPAVPDRHFDRDHLYGSTDSAAVVSATRISAPMLVVFHTECIKLAIALAVIFRVRDFRWVFLHSSVSALEAVFLFDQWMFRASAV